jgi:predicted acyltransferase
MPARLTSLDVFRGAIMVFLVSVGFGFKEVARKRPDSPLWQFLGYHTDHAPWLGGGAWDMIQPAFMFMVGVAMPFSFAARQAQGHSFRRQFGHAARRAFILVVLAVFLASNRSSHQTLFVFTNVLGQMGLGYLFVFLLVGRGLKAQLAALAMVAVGYWMAFALHPLPQPDFNYASVGVRPSELRSVVLPGFFAHWSKHANFAGDFDRWFLNLFPTEKPFVFNPGGYQTLNFIPSLITMILGLMAGERLRRNQPPGAKARWLVLVGLACLTLGLLAGATVCPIVKRIWTPSWAIFSGGIVLLLLAAFYVVIDVRGWKRWTFPFVVVGTNSIAIYLMDLLVRDWVGETLKVHLGAALFGGTYGVIGLRCTALLVLWLACWWMYRRKVFLKI